MAPIIMPTPPSPKQSCSAIFSRSFLAEHNIEYRGEGGYNASSGKRVELSSNAASVSSLFATSCSTTRNTGMPQIVTNNFYFNSALDNVKFN